MTAFVPHRLRPEWADLEPVPQDDGPNPLVPIAYTEEYRSASDMFRAVTRRNEHSERALELTWEIINFNPAHYTVWHYRSVLLDALKKDLHAELDLIAELAADFPKCYQLWHHRQVVVEKIGEAPSELSFIAEALEDDSKNYHAWSYRQWVIRHFKLWDNELEYLDGMIDADVRNNSAWNQRYFVLKNNPKGPTTELIDKELQYAFDKIRLAAHNESPWNYMLGIVALVGFDARPEIERFCREYWIPSALGGSTRVSPFALGALLDICDEKVARGDTSAVEEAVQICEALEQKHDVIRANYWARRKETMAKAASAASSKA